MSEHTGQCISMHVGNALNSACEGKLPDATHSLIGKTGRLGFVVVMPGLAQVPEAM